jgi:hypothetical protein
MRQVTVRAVILALMAQLAVTTLSYAGQTARTKPVNVAAAPKTNDMQPVESTQPVDQRPSVQIGAPQPWLLTDDDRVARRLRNARLQVTKAAMTTSSASYSEAIDGQLHPELFFPFELFDYLLWGVSTEAKDQTAAHHSFDTKLAQFGYTPDVFWKMLGTTASAYLVARELHRRAGPRSHLLTLPTGQKVLVPIDREVCLARIEALASARREFGGERFDRMLYGVVAPQVKASYGGHGDHSAILRYMAGGCQ